MDNKSIKYEAAIVDILKQYAEIKYDNIIGGNQLIVDRENLHYQVVTMGWEGHQFVHDCPIHIDIIADKVWIQHNMTEWELGELLEERGVPKTDIVVGFLSPDLRAYTKYALA